MATSRLINTKLWRDPYVRKLDRDEKLLFIYLLTNQYTTMAGIYEINIDDIAHETGIDEEIVKKALYKFQADHKILYEREWMVVTNFIKHQRLNPSMIRGIEKDIEKLPEWLQERINLAENEEKQLSIFITNTPQSDNSLAQSGTDSPQLNIIKSNIIKLNKTKSNGTGKPDGDSGKTEKQKKRDYAIAMDKEREQKAKADEARGRTGTGLSKFQATRDKLKRGTS